MPIPFDEDDPSPPAWDDEEPEDDGETGRPARRLKQDDLLLRRLREVVPGLLPEWDHQHARPEGIADECRDRAEEYTELQLRQEQVTIDLLAGVMTFIAAVVLEDEGEERTEAEPGGPRAVERLRRHRAHGQAQQLPFKRRELRRLAKAAFWLLLEGCTPDEVRSYLARRTVKECAADFDRLAGYVEAKALVDAWAGSGDAEGQA